MPTDKSIEDLVDKIINKSTKFEIIDEETKNPLQEPFRYLTDKDEIKSMLTPKGVRMSSIINLPEAAKMVDGVEVLSGLGDTDAIESVIQKHIQSRKLK